MLKDTSNIETLLCRENTTINEKKRNGWERPVENRPSKTDSSGRNATQMHNTSSNGMVWYHTKNRKQSNSLSSNKPFRCDRASTICIPRSSHEKDRNSYNFPVITFFFACVLWWCFGGLVIFFYICDSSLSCVSSLFFHMQPFTMQLCWLCRALSTPQSLIFLYSYCSLSCLLLCYRCFVC